VSASKEFYNEKVQLNASDRIPCRKRLYKGEQEKQQVVKIYHELTDDFGNPLRNSKTFNLREQHENV